MKTIRGYMRRDYEATATSIIIVIVIIIIILYCFTC
jgi:hypothetical protein